MMSTKVMLPLPMGRIQIDTELQAYFQNVDYIDVKTIEGEASLRCFISGMLSYCPRWILVLYQIRKPLARALGLARHEKPKVLPSLKPESLSFEPGQSASFFIVRAAKEDTYWVSETPKDKHLIAYFGVTAEDSGNRRRRFRVFTTVKFIHWTGPLYFNLIRPFHHLVVRRMMKAGIRMCGSGGS